MNMSLTRMFGIAVLVFGYFSAALAEENGLPWESDLTKLKLNKISVGDKINLNFHLTIPETQKVSQGAPSHVTVFEREKGTKLWVETKKINLSGIAKLLNDVSFNESIRLRSPDSEVAVHATIYHCGKKDTKIPCFIQGFQGFPGRDVKLKNKTAVDFNAKAFVY